MAEQWRQPKFESLEFTDEQLDGIFEKLHSDLQAEIDRRAEVMLAERGLSNVRRGSNTWLGARRLATRAMSCEAEQRLRESEMGE